MKQTYINCLKKLREFRKNLKIDKDIKKENYILLGLEIRQKK